MPTYTVENPVRYEGHRRDAGETVEMPKDVAQPLLKGGWLAEMPAATDEGGGEAGGGKGGGRKKGGGQGQQGADEG